MVTDGEPHKGSSHGVKEENKTDFLFHISKDTGREDHVWQVVLLREICSELYFPS